MKVDVEYIADLAKLELNDDEKEMYQKQLERIVTFVQEINELDTENVPPTYQTPTRTNIVREDSVDNTLTSEEAVSNAPETDGSHILTEGVLDE